MTARTILNTLFLFIFFTPNVFCQKSSDIIGTWVRTDYWNNPSEFIFTENGFTSFTINGEILGGENFNIQGQKADLRYSVDSSKNPFWFDLIVYSRTDQVEKGRLRGILKFISLDEIVIGLNFDGNRLTDFGEENNESTIKLKRIK